MAEFNSEDDFRRAASDRFPDGMPVGMPGASTPPPGAAPASPHMGEGQSLEQPWLPSGPLQPRPVSGSPDEEADAPHDFDSGAYAATGYGAATGRHTPPQQEAGRGIGHGTDAGMSDDDIVRLLRQVVEAKPDLLRRITADPEPATTSATRYVAPPDARFAPRESEPAAKQRAIDLPEVAKMGWRGWVARTFNMPIKKGKNEERQDLLNLARGIVNTQFEDSIVIGVTSFKGGCGKTPVTVLLGGIIAQIRNQPVLAIDADLHGTLLGRGTDPAQWKPDSGHATLLASRLQSYGSEQVDLEQYVHRGEGSLDVLSGNTFGKKSLLTREQYRAVLDKARQDYRIIIVDMSQVKEADLYDEVMKSLDALVMLTTPTETALVFQENMATFLRGHDVDAKLGLQRITMINHIYPKDNADIATLAEGLRLADRAPDDPDRRVEVCELPFDRHIAQNTQIHLDRIAQGTREELILAAGALFDATLNANPKEQSYR
ncbi:hypothetical protein [Rhodococcus sp. BS-15]|uniref:tyrosine-protein kinase family protein n=1 Tax=Rhodococcus sp. BS-15 TaxID=1304954 RepID=UPI000FFB0868|nr:hypothetical protein [Rhodococcus sp. BS-15]